jgi:undecaprenyl-phosphate 4-deoxy-4-formamido-L-arabinose transferase
MNQLVDVSMEKLSFVIPCYGSELTIIGVIEEIHAAMSQKSAFDYEIICVNDGSPDNVLSILKERVKIDSKLICIDLTSNNGKGRAVLAGYSIVSGSYIVNLDDDGQCPLYRLWDLLAPIQSGYDVAYANYAEKKQSALKNFGSRINAITTHHLIGKPKNLQISNFSIAKRFVVEEIKKYKGSYPFISGFTIKITKNIANVSMEERERAAGRGNYTLRKSFSLWLNGFTAFSIIPLRISSIIGFITALAGILYGISIVIRRLFITLNMATGYPSIMAAILFVGGMMMLMLGMLGEYVGRIYINQNNLPQFVIRDIYRNNADEKNTNKMAEIEGTMD